MTQLTIDIGAEGLFRLKAPFDTLITANVSYKCTAVRKLSEIIASGIDPLATYYTPATLAESVYNADLVADVSIASLTSGTGQWLYVPTSYILAYPDLNGVTYSAVMLGVSLGALPNGVDLSALKTIINNIVRDTLGVTTSNIKEIIVSDPSVVPHDDHVRIVTARTALININKSDRAKLNQANALNTALQAKLTELENYIEAHLPP